MLPLSDVNRAQRFPIATALIVLCNIAVYLAELSLGEARILFYQQYGLIPKLFFSVHAWLERGFTANALPLLTHMFIHGDLFHIAFNMWFLWVFGDNIEDILGSLRFVVFYLLCGMCAALGNALFTFASATPVIGASGAVSGVMGAYLILFPLARIRTLVPIFFFLPVIAEVPAFLFIGMWFLGQVFSGLLSFGQYTGIAWWAHIFGFLGGIYCYLKYFRRRPRPPRVRIREIPLR